MLWRPVDLCGAFPGCRIKCDPATGEPTGYEFRCSFHARLGHDHADVAAQQRALSWAVGHVVDSLAASGRKIALEDVACWINRNDGVVEVALQPSAAPHRTVAAAALQQRFGGKVRLV